MSTTTKTNVDMLPPEAREILKELVEIATISRVGISVFKRLRAKFPKRKKPKKRDLQSLGEEVDLLKNNFDRLVDIATKNAVKTSEGFMSVGKLVETIGKLIAVMDERKIFQSVSYTVQVIKIVNSHDARLKVLESSMAAGKSKGRQKKTKAPKPKIPLELGFDIPDKHSGTA